MGYDTIRNDVDIQLWYEEATKAIPDILAYYPQLIKASDHNLSVNESEQWKVRRLKTYRNTIQDLKRKKNPKNK